MEVSTKKSKIITNSTNYISADISMNGHKLQEVTSFKYLGAILYKDGTCSAEVHIKIASDMAAMARLSRIWLCNTISFASKFKLHKSPVTSILLYGCETCMRKLLHISSVWVRGKTTFFVGLKEPLLATLKRQKVE